MKRLSFSVLFLILITFCGPACYHVRYANKQTVSASTETGRNNFFLWGLVGKGQVDATSVCSNGFAKIDVYQTFLDGFLGAITLGIYTPRSYKIHCAS